MTKEEIKSKHNLSPESSDELGSRIDDIDKAMDDYAKDEIKKCRDSPYYYITKYVKINGEPFKTTLTEEQFNYIYNKNDESKMRNSKEPT